MNTLEICIDLEDYTAGLTGTLSSESFGGFGGGWFNLVDLKTFIDKSQSMLDTLSGKANLVAGQKKPDGSEYLETFGLRCYPVGATGTIGVHVTLADHPYTDCRKEEIYTVSGELKTEVQLFQNFIFELSKLIEGSKDKAVLVGK